MATILCVDDDPAILELHGTLLRSKGYEVFTAPDGLSGIAITRQRHIDVVVLDINMPGMDGVQVAEVLKTERPTLPVVMWSAGPEEIPESLKWFAAALLYKGDGPLPLLLAIEKILKDSRRRNNLAKRMINKAPIPTIGRLGAEIQGSVFECTKCGGEVTFVSVPKDGRALNVPVHVSSITIACPDSK